MAAKKSAKYPYKWPDGEWHSRPYAGHGAAPAPRRPAPVVRPPPGTYDVDLDAQERAAARGLSDLLQDIEKGSTRQMSDWQLGLQGLARQRQEFGEDIATERAGVERGYQRSLSDLLTQRQQEQQDYATNVATLGRNYANLAAAQAGRQRAAGIRGGGVAQAVAKRAANQARQQSTLDVALNRFMGASQLQQQRLGENRQLSLDDLLRQQQRGYGTIERAGGEATLGYQRNIEDYQVQQARQQREYQAKLQDIGAARMAQATAGGWLPPGRKRRRRTVGTAGRPTAGLGGY